MNLTDIEWWDKFDPRWDSLWQSREFNTLLEGENWFTNHTLPLIKNQHIGWYDPPPNSRFYFSAWLMNSIQRRTYDNPLIHDLYVLHEALHAATLDHFFATSSDAFLALRANEIEVSLETEAWVYLREPSWIGKTFSPLWIDHPQTRKNLNKTIKDIPGNWEEDYRSLVKNVSFFQRSDVVYHDHLFTEENVYFARRYASFYPKNESEKLIEKYENLSIKWINKILHGVDNVQQGRKFLLSGDIDSFVRYLEKNQKDKDLPYSDLQLSNKKSQASPTALDAPHFVLSTLKNKANGKQ